MTARQETVWMVDDTQGNLDLYTKVLARFGGFNVDAFIDPNQAVVASQTQRPDLVIVDYMMPGLDGAELIKRLRTTLTQVPILVLSASLQDEHIRRALDAGACDYLNKPVDHRVLVNRIRVAIQDASVAKQVEASEDARRRLERDLEDAARIQQSQLPVVPQRIGSWVINGCVLPSGKIGGDLFAAFETPDGRVVSALFDVSGHGTGAGIIASRFATEFRQVVSDKSLAIALRMLNEQRFSIKASHYVCVAAIEAYRDQVAIINAGLPPVAVLCPGAATQTVVASGTPVGLMPDSGYEVTSYIAQPATRIVMVSDGLTEPFGDSDKTIDALERLGLVGGASDPMNDPAELSRRLRTDLSQVREDVLDDATLVVATYSGGERGYSWDDARDSLFDGLDHH